MAISPPPSRAPAPRQPARGVAVGSVGLRRLLAFYGHYLRFEIGWIAIALASMPFYSLASAGLVALIAPLFAEVLRAGAVPVVGEATARLPGFLDLKSLADAAYAAIRDLSGATERSAVIFVPLLLLALFALRNVADFVGSYAFQHIGFGVTTRVRNDLQARFLEQGQHFHRASPSGELVSRVVSDVAAMQSALSNRVFDIVLGIVGYAGIDTGDRA